MLKASELKHSLLRPHFPSVSVGHVILPSLSFLHPSTSLFPSSSATTASTERDRPVSELRHIGQVSGFTQPLMQQFTENNQLFSEMCTPEWGLLILFSLRPKLRKFRHLETQALWNMLVLLTCGQPREKVCEPCRNTQTK